MIKSSSSWKFIPLAEAVKIDTRPILPTEQPETEFNYIALENIESGTGRLIDVQPVCGATIRSNKFAFDSSHVLFGKLRPYLNKVVTPDRLGICSTDILPLLPDKQRLSREWLAVCLRSPEFVEYSRSKMDGAKMPRLRTPDLENFRIPIPPITEQQLLVTRIEALTDQLKQARELRKQIMQEVEEFLRALVFNDEKKKPTKMRNLLRLRPTDVAVQKTETYQFAGVYSFGRGVFKSGAKPGYDFAYSRLTRVKAGEFTYPKLMAWEGALGMVPPECDGCVVSPEFPVFEVDSDRVFPEVLDVYFRTPSVWPKLAGLSTGTNVRRRRLNPQAFLDYEMALPSRATQLKVRAAYAKQTELRRLQKETETELATFTPALLAKAFRGEL